MIYYTPRGERVSIPQDAILRDGSRRPWELYKIQANLMAAAYAEFDTGKAARVAECAKLLAFGRDPVSGKLHLQKAGFCRVRLCPICQWRRSLKVFGQSQQIVQWVQREQPSVRWVLLTLTQRNVDGEHLGKAIDDMHAAWHRLLKRKDLSAVLGSMRATEITYNAATKEYHPHIHALLAVRPSYFTRDYIKHEDWVALWQSCQKLDYSPSVDIRAIKGDTSSAIAEVAKYATKSAEILDPIDMDSSSLIAYTLDEALRKRRCVSWSGLLAKAHRALMLDDAEDGDLIHIRDDEDQTEAGAPEPLWFSWWSGPRLYINDKMLR